jgi:hypothetical protein
VQDVVEAVRDGGDLAISQEVLVTDQGQWAQDFFLRIFLLFAGFVVVTPHWESTIVRYTLLVTNLPGSEKHSPPLSPTVPVRYIPNFSQGQDH